MARYSYSKLAAYRNCPLQYRFRYIEKIPVEVAPSIEAFMGSCVHAALEWLYKRVRDGRTPADDEVLAIYGARWAASGAHGLRIVNPDQDEAGFRETGRRCLERYMQRHRPFGDGLVLGLEETFQMELSDGTQLNGVIDRLMKTQDGAYEVHDYKTSQHLPTPDEARADEQGGWYALAVRRRFPAAREIRLVWHYLRHDEEFVSARTPGELAALQADIAARVRAVESATEFPARESRLCAWCDYVGRCPVHGHRHALTALPPSDVTQETGVTLVNRLSELRASLRAATTDVNEEIECVEAALVRYARERGYTVVVGDQDEAVISERPAVAFPRKGEPGREPLEALVRELGLWDDVSDLSLSKLGDKFEGDDVPLHARAQLAAFGAPDRHLSVRLRRRRERDRAGA